MEIILESQKYPARFIGAAMSEHYKFDKIICVVASQHDPHQKKFFKLLKLVKPLVYAMQQCPAPSLDQTFEEAGNAYMNTYIKLWLRYD